MVVYSLTQEFSLIKKSSNSLMLQVATPIFLSYSAEAKKLRIEKIENKEKEIK